MFKDIIDLSGDRDERRLVEYMQDNNTVKQSDFSIDHILNRAGKKLQCDNNKISSNFYRNCSEFNGVDESGFSNCAPMFSWLHYTRYRPPKLPRSAKMAPVKRTPGRLPRVPFTVAQLGALEDAYKKSTYLSSEDANKLATTLDLTSTRVKIWFQNRRARERREKRLTDGETLDLSLHNVKDPLKCVPPNG